MSKELLSDNEFSFLVNMFADIVGTMVTDKMHKVFTGIAEYKEVFAKANHFINTVMYDDEDIAYLKKAILDYIGIKETWTEEFKQEVINYWSSVVDRLV
mgnify:CR=1 FL=1